MAGALQARGVAPGDHVAILGPTTRPLVTAIQAVWLAGAAAVLLPLPMRLGTIEAFVAQTRARIAHSDATLAVVDDDLLAFLDPHPDAAPIVALRALSSISRSGSNRFDAPVIDPASLAILQFTSGSTSEPKGVMLPHAQVCANLDAIASGVEIDPASDIAVSWLPLYHDMGLIGLLATPMTTGTALVLAAPQDFLAAPARWLQWISDYRGTITAGPNFSYALAARAMARMERLDLSSWRLGLNGAETVDPAAVEAFVAAGARHGLRPESVFAAFGMAEATLAVTFPRPFGGLATDSVDRRVLETERFAAPVDPSNPQARRLTRLGRPVAGLEIRIVDPITGTEMLEREAGELQIRGSSITTGYYKLPEATAVAFDGDWLRSGDLAYLVDGELVICGRLKDVIIFGGRNVFPEDIERAAGGVDGVRVGNVIAFGIDGRRGKEAVIVVAESKATPDEAHIVKHAVALRVREMVGVPPEDVVLVLPGSLPKTSSGKLQRSLCRDRYLGEELQLT